MINTLTLPSDRFVDDSLGDIKNKNFIFGKNGTGKTSIANQLYEQYAGQYDVRLFQGFDKIIAENRGLNTISLGIENTTLQPKIQSLEEEVDDIEADCIIADNGKETTYSKFVELRKQEDEKKHEIDQFLSQAASEIKNAHPDWTGANFNKNTFLSEIGNANLLSEEQYKLNVKRVNESLTSPTHLEIPTINLQQLYERVNTVLTKEIVRKAKISFDSDALMNWVKDGLKLHTDRETCAFCASQLSDERIEQLVNCFDDELDVLNSEISRLMELIDGLKEKVSRIPTISSHEYNLEFRQEVQDLNETASSQKSLVVEFLTALTKNLSMRKTSIFNIVPTSITSVPGDFGDIKDRYEKLFGKQKNYGEELQTTRERAKQSLIANEVAKQIRKVDYQELINEREYLTGERTRAEVAVENRKVSLSTKREQLSELRSMTVNVDSAAEKINDYLKVLGNQAFTLSHASMPGTEGQYRILSYDGTVRDIETLSTGEKNIVAFLWFVIDLDNVEKDSAKERIIIFDDPMNSNDDTVQYLIVKLIQGILKNCKKDQIFILTHNIHFYLNVRYKWWDRSKREGYDKRTFHLYRVGYKSSVRLIDSAAEDLKTSYDALWHEVRSLYEANQAEYMLNPLRRIFETYSNFNSIRDIFGDDIEAEKLFDVNSHGIDDLEADLNGKDCKAIIQKVETIFSEANAEEHFVKHWGSSTIDK